MPEDRAKENHRAGYVAMVGRPNVGKSTLVNAFLGQIVAPVAPLPQTTRRNQLGILTLENAQVIFVDTPGLHKPRHKLGERMNEAARQALQDADLALVLFDASEPPTAEDQRVAQAIQELAPGLPRLAALNKIDLIKAQRLAEMQAAFEAILPDTPFYPLSATRGDGRQELLEALLEKLPPGEPYFPPDQITDYYEREIAAELIRAACMHILRQEIPHAIAVRIDEYKERNEHGAFIAATLFVERESQKPIVIGRNGSVIKEIGTIARREIEAMSGRKVFLELRVKVLPRWRNDEGALKRLGFLARRSL
jgi:GTP-binding protein Era